MTTAGCRPIEHAGLTWRILARSIGVTEREFTLLRVAGPGRTGPVHRAIAALARDLTGGDERIIVGDHDSGEG